jgi:hypothetical protein
VERLTILVTAAKLLILRMLLAFKPKTLARRSFLKTTGLLAIPRSGETLSASVTGNNLRGCLVGQVL